MRPFGLKSLFVSFFTFVLISPILFSMDARFPVAPRCHICNELLCPATEVDEKDIQLFDGISLSESAPETITPARCENFTRESLPVHTSCAFKSVMGEPGFCAQTKYRYLGDMLVRAEDIYAKLFKFLKPDSDDFYVFALSDSIVQKNCLVAQAILTYVADNSTPEDFFKFITVKNIKIQDSGAWVVVSAFEAAILTKQDLMCKTMLNAVVKPFTFKRLFVVILK